DYVSFFSFCLLFFFFFSSRRRHTRWPRDWSSDVCSSDLARERGEQQRPGIAQNRQDLRHALQQRHRLGLHLARASTRLLADEARSEERRVGKECRSRWSREHKKKIENKVDDILIILSASM